MGKILLDLEYIVKDGNNNSIKRVSQKTQLVTILTDNLINQTVSNPDFDVKRYLTNDYDLTDKFIDAYINHLNNFEENIIRDYKIAVTNAFKFRNMLYSELENEVIDELMILQITDEINNIGSTFFTQYENELVKENKLFENLIMIGGISYLQSQAKIIAETFLEDYKLFNQITTLEENEHYNWKRMITTTGTSEYKLNKDQIKRTINVTQAILRDLYFEEDKSLNTKKTFVELEQLLTFSEYDIEILDIEFTELQYIKKDYKYQKTHLKKLFHKCKDYLKNSMGIQSYPILNTFNDTMINLINIEHSFKDKNNQYRKEYDKIIEKTEVSYGKKLSEYKLDFDDNNQDDEILR